MKKLFALAAVLSGFILFEVLEFVVGHLAALAIPREYFLWFGKPHIVLALTIEEAFVIALPMFLLSTLWSLLTNLMLGKNYLLISLSCLIGYALDWTLTMLNTDINLMLVVSTMFQPFYILSSIAVPTGILFAGFVVFKFNRSRQPR